MMSRFFTNNLVDNSIITADYAEGLPASNLKDSQLSKITRIHGGVVEFNFQGEKDVQAIIIANHNLTVPVKVEAYSTIVTPPAWSTVATLAPSATVLYAQCNPIKAEKVKLTFASDSVDIGRVFLGGYSLVRRGLSPDGYSVEYSDESESQTSLGGQEYTAIQLQRRAFKLGWTALTDTELAIFRALYASHGKHTPFFVWVKELLTQPTYVKLDGSFAPEMIAGVVPRRWDHEIALKEQL